MISPSCYCNLLQLLHVCLSSSYFGEAKHDTVDRHAYYTFSRNIGLHHNYGGEEYLNDLQFSPTGSITVKRTLARLITSLFSFFQAIYSMQAFN